MKPRALLSVASIFTLVLAASGGCDRREEPPAQRAPRVVGSSAELFALDDTGTVKDDRVLRELVGDWTPPAVIETVRPPPPRKPRRAVALPPPTAEVAVVETPVLPPMPVAAEPPPPAAPAPAPPSPRAQEPRPTKPEVTWQTLPEPRNARTDAINASVAIGTIAVGMGSAAVSGDNASTGARAFAIGSLGVGVVSFSTALVLYLTEPAPQPGASTPAKKTSGVTVTPGVLGVGGTF